MRWPATQWPHATAPGQVVEAHAQDLPSIDVFMQASVRRDQSGMGSDQKKTFFDRSRYVP
jgi:hypothetical protein